MVNDLIGVLILILVAAVVYWLLAALGLPYIVCAIGAVLVLAVGVSAGRSRWR
jgi:hypothetical protein